MTNLEYVDATLARLIAACSEYRSAYKSGDMAAENDAIDHIDDVISQLHAVPPLEPRDYDDEASDAAHRREDFYRDINEAQPK